MANKLLYTYSRSTNTGAEAIPAEKLTTYHDSLIFDTDRKSIWAVGTEFGYATHMNQGSASSSEYGVITSIGTTADGTVSYTYADLSGTNNGNFLTSFTQNKNGKVSVTTGSFSNAASKSTAASYVSYVYIDATGKLSYTYADIYHTTNNGEKQSAVVITGTGAVNALTGITISQSGVISYSYAPVHSTFTSLSTATDARTNKQYIINSALSNNNGAYTITNTYAAHTIETAVAGSVDVDSVNVFSQNVSQNASTGALTFKRTSYELTTKHYVDRLVQANDAMRYCGTVTPGTAKGSAVTFTYTAPAGLSYTSTWAFSRGALYKVSASGYIGDEYVLQGDMVICNTDAATITGPAQNSFQSSAFANWDIINENLNLTTVKSPGNNVTITNSNALNVITGVNLDASGALTYHYQAVNTTHSTNKGTKENPMASYIAGVSISADGTISYTYGTVYHKCVTETQTAAPYVTNSIHITASGELSYTNTAINTADYHYAPTGAQSYAVTSTAEKEAITKITTDAKGHIVAVEKGSIDDHHGGSFGSNTGTQTIGTTSATKATFVTSASLSAAGTLTGTTGTISHATSGVTAGSYGLSANATPGFGGTFNVPYFTVNDCGHITAAATHTISMPSQSHHGGSITAPAGNYVASVSLNTTGTLSGSYTPFTSITAGAASKLVDTVDVGSASLPVYFVDGLPKTISSLNLGSGNITTTGTVTANTFTGALNGNASTATTATKLGTTNVGDAMTPIYLNAGTPTASTYTIKKSVPANAVFTDTDTKVTSVSNHYTPSENTASALTASGATVVADNTVLQVVTGLKRDAAGHVVGITSGAIKNTHYTNTLTLNVDGNSGSTVFTQSADKTFTVPKAADTTYGTVTINEVKATKVNNAAAADSATTATKLSTETAGDENTPIYFANGKPVSTGKSIGNASGNIPLSNGSINTNLNADMVDFCHITIDGSRATTAQTINFVT